MVSTLADAVKARDTAIEYGKTLQTMLDGVDAHAAFLAEAAAIKHSALRVECAVAAASAKESAQFELGKAVNEVQATPSSPQMYRLGPRPPHLPPTNLTPTPPDPHTT